jgi:hypothetical protein
VGSDDWYVLEPPPTDCVPDPADPTAAAAPGAVVVVAPEAVDAPPVVAPLVDFLAVELPVAPELVLPAVVLPPLLVPLLLLVPPLLFPDAEMVTVIGSGGGVAPTPRLPWNCGSAQLEADSVGGGCPVR